MKTFNPLLVVATAAVMLLLSSCVVHRTVAPAPTTTTVVTTTQPSYAVSRPVVSTSKRVIVASATTPDISLDLDLQAVAALFAQSRDVETFEVLLNTETEGINNLDLNGDGYVDYLRVLENYENGVHVIVLQAVLAQNIFQDVATLVVEREQSAYYVQVVGNPYVYGENYIVQPTYYRAPLIYSTMWVYNYQPWRSPYYWGYYPAHFSHHKPLPYSAYQPHISRFMSNHAYCHQATYPTQVHYTNYQRVAQPISRNDYSRENPQRSFAQRTANMQSSSSGSTTVRNTRDLSNTRGTVNNTSTNTQQGSERVSSTSGSTVRTGNSRTTVNTSGSSAASTSKSSSVSSAGNSRASSTTSSGAVSTGNSRATSASGSAVSTGSSRTSSTSDSRSVVNNSRSNVTTNAETQKTITTGSSRSNASSGSSSTVSGNSRSTKTVSGGSTSTTNSRSKVSSSSNTRTTSTSGGSRSKTSSTSSTNNTRSGSSRTTSSSNSRR